MSFQQDGCRPQRPAPAGHFMTCPHSPTRTPHSQLSCPGSPARREKNYRYLGKVKSAYHIEFSAVVPGVRCVRCVFFRPNYFEGREMQHIPASARKSNPDRDACIAGIAACL